ncbi:CHAD domain-containing protein [Streptomyces muensis]|uniref:CHAD domain-containing protein n=2 Tax=Streptomyces muensis TaxID=1077944 RepID=A0A9X1Q4S2_STRM4|nr:CHAD domain-containing protein [Streptomyces muensis]MCF1597884.1 CHAD domain-containing protein [Streptomyces muensis]
MTGDALAGYLRAQATEFLRALRLHRETGGGTEESVDAARALRRSARRISASLHTFRPLLDPDWSESIRPELAWLSGTLALEHAYAARLERLLLALHRLSGATPLPTQMPTPDALGTSAGGGSAGVTAGGRNDLPRASGNSAPSGDHNADVTGSRADAGAGHRGDAAARGRADAGAGGRANPAAGGRPDTAAGARDDAMPGVGADTAAGNRANAAADGRTDAAARRRANAAAGGRTGAAASSRIDAAAANRADGAAGDRAGRATGDRIDVAAGNRADVAAGNRPNAGASSRATTAAGSRPDLAAGSRAAGSAPVPKRAAPGSAGSTTHPAATPDRGNLTVGAAKAGALLDRQLTLARTRAHSSALQALGSSRFHAVADSIAVLASEVPLTAAAATTDLHPLAAAAEERLTDAVTALPLVTAGHPYNAEALIHGLSPDPAPHPQDAPWHQVRLLLRLHRYAREVLHGDTDPVDVRLLAAGQSLNRHRDASEAAAAAAQAARTPRIAPATAYALGVLHADQRHEVEAARFAFQQCWQRQTVGTP